MWTKPATSEAVSAEAFGTLLREHQGRVRAYLRRYIADPASADDVAQETFLTAYRRLADRDPASPVELWLLGIARNRALRWLRDERRRRARETSLASRLVDWSAERLDADGGRLEDREREVTALRQCLAGLPDHGSALIASFYYRRLSSAEIARREGRTESAVRMTLLRLRDALRQCVRLRIAGEGSVR